MTEEKMSQDEFLAMRQELAMGRIREIPEDATVPAPYRSYFEFLAGWILHVEELKAKIAEDYYRTASIEEIRKENRALYEDILGENYETSFGNPSYAVSCLGVYGQSLCLLYGEVQGILQAVHEGRLFDETIILELFVEIYNMFEGDELPDPEAIRKTIYWYVSDYCDELMEYRTRELVDPSLDFAVKIIREADFSDLRYLYQFGEYISENELETARFLNSLPEEEIDAMASTLTEGYRRGFILGRKPLEKKKTVELVYQLGFERMIRACIEKFAEMGLSTVISRYAIHVLSRRGGRRGFTGAIANKQYDYDHRQDMALIVDDDLIKRMLRSLQVSYDKVKSMARSHGGPAWIEMFGEEPFEPVVKKEALSMNPAQQKLMIRYSNEAGQITNRYIPGDETSFSIISYPLPEIGPNYEEIFRDTVKINTLDNDTYRVIQEKLIDALNQGTSVRIRGCGANETDLTVALYPLTDPEHQSIFENCLADVNIPLGEVFTTPVLKGTNGLLHVTQIYLEGLLFKDLKVELKDGMIASCSVANFESEEENRTFLEDNLLYHHETLPIGEFAIGTNTLAYAPIGSVS